MRVCVCFGVGDGAGRGGAGPFWDRPHPTTSPPHPPPHTPTTIDTNQQPKPTTTAKEAKKIAAHFGYTAHSNPFGDANLHQQFVWKAKEKQQASKSGGGGGQSKAAEAERRLELIREIEKVCVWVLGCGCVCVCRWERKGGRLTEGDEMCHRPPP